MGGDQKEIKNNRKYVELKGIIIAAKRRRIERKDFLKFVSSRVHFADNFIAVLRVAALVVAPKPSCTSGTNRNHHSLVN